MSKKLYEETNIQNIASAIREQNGTQNSYTVAQMGSAIRAIKTQPDLETLTVTENGSYLPSTGKDGFSSVIVNVESGEAVVQPLSATQNGIYNPPTGVDGYAPVTVNVEGGGSLNPEKDQPGATVIGLDPDDGNEYEIVRDYDGELVKTKLISSIQITTPPTKTSYTDGEALDYTGLEVTGYYGDGSSVGIIPISQLNLPVETATTDLNPYQAINGHKITVTKSGYSIAPLGVMDHLSDTYEFDDGRLIVTIGGADKGNITNLVYDGTVITTSMNLNTSFKRNGPITVGYTDRRIIFYHASDTYYLTDKYVEAIRVESISPLVPVKYIRQADNKILESGFSVSVS